LVLLFPFLKEYLKSCNIADNEQIFDPEDAIHLLQYLVNFQTNTFENQLILNKILCGLPINFPIKKEFKIDDNQQEQAKTLLSAVIKYWSVMKNTSIEGLQISFLRRNGKLSKKTDGWLLQVEQAPYDMLLDELPWTYSVVSLPWMSEMLLVEWS
jgi:Contractile injection system tape measure protein